MSTALRLLIHYVGDIHQPLHSSTRINDEFPESDIGGNAFALKSHYGVKELHAVWDDVFWQYYGHQVTPFSDADWDAQGANVTDLLQQFEVSDEEANDLDVNTWAAESYQITHDFVYKGIKQHEHLPDDYVQQGLVIAERRLVLAGHRLANILKNLNLDHYQPTQLRRSERIAKMEKVDYATLFSGVAKSARSFVEGKLSQFLY
jgi:hypothetical protein